MDSGIFDGFIRGCVTTVIVVLLIALAVTFFVTKAVYKTEKLESKTLIIPEKKYITDGKKIDSVYIYRKP